MSKNRFKNKNGDLSKYAFMCGHVQHNNSISNNIYEVGITCIYREHDVYVVETRIPDKKNITIGYKVISYVFGLDELTRARAMYRTLCKNNNL